MQFRPSLACAACAHDSEIAFSPVERGTNASSIVMQSRAAGVMRPFLISMTETL